MAESLLKEYKPNSNRYKEEQQKKEAEKKVEKVVNSKVVTKKKSAFSKFTDEFVSEDAKNIKSYVFGEVLIPAVKKAVCDIVVDSINMFLYGDARRGTKRSTADRVSYRNYADEYNRPSRTYRDSASRYSYDEIGIESRAEAEDVLDRMYELIDTYKLVTVADFYDLIGVTGQYTDNSYGWTSLRNADIVRGRDGMYYIKLPRAMPIDR